MFRAIFLATQLFATDTSFADAKARADEYESVLGHKDGVALIEAQGKALSAAMTECGPAKKSFPPFAIVVRVSKNGVTERTWRNDDSPFAICLDLHLARAFLPVAAGKPFYASYELDSAP